MPAPSSVIRETVLAYPGQTLRDLRALPEGTAAQLIDGALVMSPSPTFRHQHIVAQLQFALTRYVRERDLGHVLGAPLDVVFSETHSFQPDLVFVSKARFGIIAEEGLRGAPDLVAEVLSPSTAYYDLTIKREVYERFGVTEYWILDPKRETVEVLALRGDAYEPAASARHEGTAASALLDGFTVDLADLFTLPTDR